MKRIAFLVLVLATIVIADEEEQTLQEIASFYDADVQTTKGCLTEAGIVCKGWQNEKETWQKIINDDDDEETKESITVYGRFIACMLEKKDMMKDSKLVLNKILETFEKKESTLTKIESKDIITECVNIFNEDVELTRENRALNFVICITRNKEISKDRK
ncbi:uncharacterized protein [Anoplolepis gracilipes]|uniref:uncharacterized protein n=1 Tax=Anoplolepis gracilipes TaxID=354296 RepID=UPI003BA1774E